MFNFWPLNIPRKRREAAAAEQRLADEQRKRVEEKLFGQHVTGRGQRFVPPSPPPHAGRNVAIDHPRTSPVADNPTVWPAPYANDYCAPSPGSYDSGSSSCDSSSSSDSGSCSSSCD